MSTIRILDPVIVDRIAAGEVVERPASVVKELVENALDAGATRVDVRLESGGRALIEVEDDGHGMGAEDARLAFAQHATSKIHAVEDLDDIATLGFRGEALASIAAVARVELTTGRGRGVGTRVRVAGGTVERVDEAASPRGTRVSVRDLFFNTPARHKHLRTDATETGRVGGVVEDFALLRPDIHLSLTVDGRSRLAAAPVASLADRVHQVLGSDVAAAWLDVEHTGARCRVHGGVTSPEETRSGRQHIHLFVNGRAVADGRLAHAVVAAFDTLLPARRAPVAALFVELAPEDVDVNVHPRKAEVRFTEPGRIYGTLRRAVAQALAGGMGAPLLGTALGAVAPAGPAPVPDSGTGESTVRESSLPLREWRSVRDPSAAPVVAPGALQPLAQYANTYIVAASDEGLLIIDQHVAHERVLYEQILEQRQDRGVPVQRLLVPETLELSAAEAAAAADNGDLLGSFGFEVEPFGGSTWQLRGTPELLGPRRASEALRAILADLAEQRGAETGERLQRELAASLACHSAVRANQPLSPQAMAGLLADLGRCRSPTRCPHGRPVMLRLDHERLEREIGRRH